MSSRSEKPNAAWCYALQAVRRSSRHSSCSQPARAQHPSGVMVDSDASAVEGAPTSSRIRYAGTALRHLDPRRGVPLGLVAASGWWAGMCAAKHVSQ